MIRSTAKEHEKDRSAGDRERHRHLVRDIMKKNIGDLIAEESIIGKNRDRTVKVPIKGVKEYRFIYGENRPGVAEGDSGTEPGQIIGKDGDQQGKEGKDKAGNQPGVDYYETEIDISELLQMMFEDLKLPDLVQKQLRLLTSEREAKHKGYRSVGIRVRLSKKETIIEKTRRKIASGFTEFAKAFPEKISQQAEYEALLEQYAGDASMLYKIESWYFPEHGEYVLRFRLSNDDQIFRHMELEEKEESNAVVICIMDTSGSMDTMKKYLARGFFYLLYEFVRTKYRNVEVVFVAHAAEGKEVTEEEFFHKGESGGTLISSGYTKALEIIYDRYHPTLWNVYAVHCSDGDNFESDNPATLKAANELCEVCNLFGYVEVKPEQNRYYESSMRAFFTKNIKKDNWGQALIIAREDVYPALKKILEKAKTDVLINEKEAA